MQTRVILIRNMQFFGVGPLSMPVSLVLSIREITISFRALDMELHNTAPSREVASD